MMRYWPLFFCSLIALGATACRTTNADPTRLSDQDPITTSGPKIFTDHLGYERLGPKVAVVKLLAGGLTDAVAFELVDSRSGAIVHSGKLAAAEQVPDWSASRFRRADFSDVRTSGEFKLQVRLSDQSTIVSPSFQIQDALHFRQTFDKSLEYFYRSRATSEPAWTWDATLRVVGKDSMNPVNLQGGWYDAAGDISKYLSHLSFANYLNPQQIPMTVWALANLHERNDKLPQNRSDQAQRLLAEAQFGADFLVKMLTEEGYFYISVFDQWRGDQTGRMISVPINGSLGTQSDQVQAAFREGGGMAIAALALTARMTRLSDMAASERYLQAAKRAFLHLQANNRRYCDDGKENIIDDYTALMAATELALATSDPMFKTAAQARAQNLIRRLSSRGFFWSDAEDIQPDQRSRPFWHAAEAGLPVVALARYLDLEDDRQRIGVTKAVIQTHLEYQVRVAREVANPFNYARQHFRFQDRIRSGFFIPHENESTYWWQGENARLGSLATAALMGGAKIYTDENGQTKLPKDLVSFAADQISWIIGKNPFDVSFMESVGRNNPPAYGSVKPGHSHLPGGIVNGVTGKMSNRIKGDNGRDIYVGGDGSGIAWNPKEAGPPNMAAWENWRWVEQWLPHTTWYMLAISSLAESQHRHE